MCSPRRRAPLPPFPQVTSVSTCLP
jgi:hypothetical protein